VQRRHQKVAGSSDAVAGENPPGAVGAMRGWRETDEQETRLRITESRNRLAPVDLVTIRTPFRPRDLGAVISQTWAAGAGDDACLNRYQTRHAFLRTIGASALHENAF
jgi:hypothetical protein